MTPARLKNVKTAPVAPIQPKKSMKHKAISFIPCKEDIGKREEYVERPCGVRECDHDADDDNHDTYRWRTRQMATIFYDVLSRNAN
jgi:hypothetical protein